MLLLMLVGGCSRKLPSSLAILHATVIDATGAPPQPDSTVLIQRQRITAVGPSGSVPVPPDAQILDATGKFLIPGLADSHVHITAAGEPTGSRQFMLPLLLANGITTVRDMGGKVGFLAQIRSEIASDKRLGPQIFFTGPYLDGDPPGYQPSIVVRNAAEARSAVDLLVSQHVDFLKVQSALGREAYFAIAAESKAKGIRFVGHVPDRVSALEASNAGQSSIEHLTGVLLACSSMEDELRKEQFFPDPPNATLEEKLARTRSWQRRLLDSYSPQKADALISAFVANGTWQVPTFSALINLAFLTPRTNLLGDARINYIPPKEFQIWRTAVNAQLEHATPADFAIREEIIQRSLEVLGKMQAAGVHIMAGSDTPAPNVFPGFSLHEGLAYLVQAGLTPMQALQAATKNPAEFFGQLGTKGTITPGKFADLVLLDADPLDDIHNTEKIRAVVLRGRLLDRSSLDALLSSVEEFAKAN
ncbi:MAG TPA: amidohydrolase family protein [Candidatus Acidoferrum sp.]|nr:amidohydrolase family protein [Candidatus Acidoferrum sp.]